MAVATEAKSADPTKGSALFAADTPNANPEKLMSTIRARLCLAGGQTLHRTDDGCFFVSTPWLQITKFDSFAALQAHVDRIAK